MIPLPPRLVSAALLLCLGCGSPVATSSATNIPGTSEVPIAPLPALPDGAAEGDERCPESDERSSEALFAAGCFRTLRGRSLDSIPAPLKADFLTLTGRDDELVVLLENQSQDNAVSIARAQLRRGRYAAAEALLTPLAEDPSNHEAQVILGELHSRQGHEAEAEAWWMRPIRGYNNGDIRPGDAAGLISVGQAAWGLRSPHDANDAYLEASRALGEDGAPNLRLRVNLAWAELFLAKEDIGHAEESVREALDAFPEHPEALAAMARVRLEQGRFGDTTSLAEQALEINPNLIAARIILAGIALRDLDIARADELLDQALATNPEDLEALSTRAAVRYLAEDTEGFREAKNEVLRRHPRFSAMYSIIAGYAEWEHRYPEIVEMSREAIALNPRDTAAQATLGLNLLRLGDEGAAIEALEDAWRGDRFNVRVYNTLNFYEERIPDYELFADGPFLFRMHRDDLAVLRRQVPGLLRGAYDGMVERYGFTPEGPLRFELLATSRDFALRTTGLPRLGVQGVCFGKVVTAMSPRGERGNWGEITWHELAHVFHIQLSRNRVPRWFTEGLAEYETLRARPEWKRELDHVLFRAINEESLPPLRLLNRAFTRARSPQAMMAAYFASTMLVKHIADEHGFDDVVAMLRAWGEGQRTEDVFQGALGASIEEIDEAFREATRQRLDHLRAQSPLRLAHFQNLSERHEAAVDSPENADAVAAYGIALLLAGARDEARLALLRARRLAPDAPLVRFFGAHLHRGNDPSQVQQDVEAFVAAGHRDYELFVIAAQAATAEGNRRNAEVFLRQAIALDSTRSHAWRALLSIAEAGGTDAPSNEGRATGSHTSNAHTSNAHTSNAQSSNAQSSNTQTRHALAIEARRALADIDEHDGALLRDLVASLLEGDPEAAHRYAERLPLILPHDPRAHLLRARAALAAGEPRDAILAAEMALAADHESPAEVHLMKLRAHLALGNRPRAADAAAEVRRLGLPIPDELEAQLR